MGTFLGHAIPGIFFILFSIWGILDSFFTYFICQFQRISYKNNTSRVRTLELSSYPMSSFLKLISIFVGMLGEFITGFESTGVFAIHNEQHMTMFAFFAFNAFFEIFYYYNRGDTAFMMPRKLDYLTGILALFVEALLFHWHLHGRGEIDVLVHKLLVIAVWIGVAASILEMIFEYEFKCVILRHGAILLQGTWFFQIGFILYPPFRPLNQWNLHTGTLIISMWFSWHIAGITIFITVVGFFIYKRVKTKYRSKCLDGGNENLLLEEEA